jgi:3-oxoacyl-[acyl-carrier-protein] synthase-1
MTQPLLVAGVGMVTPLGASTRETIAALARGQRSAARTPLVDVRGDRIVGAFALPLCDDLAGAARAERLAFPALTECIASLEPACGATAIFLCAPTPWDSFAVHFAPVIPPVRDDWPAVVDALANELEARDMRSPAALRFLIARGHASGGLALERAAALFERGEAAQALIVGIDSHGDRATLERLGLTGALKSRASPGGFVPGEAAAVLCVRPAAAGSTGVLVRGVGLDEESDTPSMARGLTSAVSQAIARWGGAARSLGKAAIDLNGERWRAKEWSFAATRTLWRDRATPMLFHPATQLGDVGAASVPLLVGLLARGPGPPGPALLVASSRDGLRAAVVLARPSG